MALEKVGLYLKHIRGIVYLKTCIMLRYRNWWYFNNDTTTVNQSSTWTQSLKKINPHLTTVFYNGFVWNGVEQKYVRVHNKIFIWFNLRLKKKGWNGLTRTDKAALRYCFLSSLSIYHLWVLQSRDGERMMILIGQESIDYWKEAVTKKDPSPYTQTHTLTSTPLSGRPTDRPNTPPPPPRPGLGINVLLFLARPCFQGKPNDAMTSMQVTSKKQTGGIEWLPLEVFAAFFLSGERRRWMRMGVKGEDRMN